MIDTTGVRAVGEGSINFRDQNLNIMLVPQVKSPSVLDLATPIRISGNFADFGASLPPGTFIQKAAELSLAVNNLWLQFFDWREMPPADGSDVCNVIPQPTVNQPPENPTERR